VNPENLGKSEAKTTEGKVNPENLGKSEAKTTEGNFGIS